jgi:hypothetical protein
MNQRRMISNGIYFDEEFSQLSLGARMLFIGMVVNADDEGRLTGNAKFLKALIFPLDDMTFDQVSAYLEEIAQSMKSVLFYEVDGKSYISFRKWEEFQTIRADRKRPSSVPVPEPIASLTKSILQPGDNQMSTTPPHERCVDVRISKEKLSKDKLILSFAPTVAKDSPKPKKPPNTEVQRLVKHLEEVTGALPANFGKQAQAWKFMQQAGYSEENMCFAIDRMWEEPYWKEHGFDLTNVMNNIAKIKQRFQDRKGGP